MRFLEAFYLRTCNSIRGFVCWSIRPLVRWSVGLSVCQHESKSGRTSFLCFFAYVCVHVGHLGVDGGWTPLPTHQQQYCGPASLVVYVSELGRELGGGLGVNEGCRPVRNNIVTPPHLFFLFF